ncbi:helix-turn-helix transcriptional regulator [Flectobacillus longus]|uniref:helix-turn-helix transcriptional regulator n=1 Tax=Flectobacillus longus TaxID=2984207 RepID=UPI0024B74C11|nr:WYL domain-containing protein [Flectobacillus longus]MDI9879232.1 WYL domain-containing protein [Flectobacillus longus]
MNKFNDNSPKYRLLAILKLLIESPNQYTKVMLETKFNIGKDAITSDFEELKDAGFDVQYDKKYRYAIVPNKPMEHLEDMLFFTEAEKEILLDALANNAKASEKRTKRMQEKLNTIYDVSKLGSSLFSRTFLSKANLLEQAKQEKKIVKLINYRSTNSSEVTDRLVEPFQVSVKEDILHAFEVEKKAIRHFRISRIERVELQDADWQYETQHYVTATDPFRIVNDHKVRVHIRLKVGGYNELIERFPLTQAYLQPSANELGVYDFECNVNEKFFGLTNFILGYHEHIVEIIEPESLIEHIRRHIVKINF